MSNIYPIKEWEQKALRHFRKQEKERDLKPLSDRKIKELTDEIFLDD